MENRYDKVMKKIIVTEPMQNRILNTINGMDWSQAPDKKISLSSYRKYLSIAACFLVLLSGTVAIYNFIELKKEPLQQAIPNIVEYSTQQELSGAVGFPVKEIRKVPFKVEHTQFTAYWGEVAEIEYSGTNNSVTLRMAPGTDDVSGDSTDYEINENAAAGEIDVILKGDQSGYKLAVWQTGQYSYSLYFTNGVSKEDMINTIINVN